MDFSNTDTEYLIKKLDEMEEMHKKAEKNNENFSYGYNMAFPKVYAAIYNELKSRNVDYNSMFLD